MSELGEIFLEKEFNQRLKWLIKLRWFAVIGVFLLITAINYAIGIKLSLPQLYSGSIALLLLNLSFFLYNNLLEKRKDEKNRVITANRLVNRFANLQISLDLLALSYLIHFSGGIENPFIFYFIFHMVIASILLSNKAAYLQATLAVGLLGGIVISEYSGLLPHHHINNFIDSRLCLSGFYILGIFSVFISTLYITVYMATSIVNRLREQEKELVATNKKLSEQDRLKSQYVLTVSHDIQSSLSTIQICLSVVLGFLSDSLSVKAKEMISRAEKRCQYLLSFVKDLLNLSKIRMTRKLERKSVSLSEIVKKVVEQTREFAEQKGLTLSVENPDRDTAVFADANLLEQLILNLMENAVKYTPWGGKIGITLKDKQNSYEIVVWDTGIGISQEDLNGIFDDFYRAKNAEQMEKDGTGLGLSIVRQIVDIHNGDVFVESEIGKGSKFIFTIPK